MYRIMNKIMDFLEKKFMPIASRIAQIKLLQAIRDGIILTMPLLIVGSLFLILAFLPIPGYDEFMLHNFGKMWRIKLLYPVGVTFDIMALIACIGISYHLAEKHKVDPLSVVAISLSSFLLVTPFNMRNDLIWIFKGIPFEYTGGQGLFVAILISVFSTEIFRLLIQKNIVIKMPPGVPPAVAKTFTALIPALIVLTLSWIIKLFFETTTFLHVHNVVNILLTAPITKIGNTYLGIITIMLIIQLLWSTGLHGSAIIVGIISPMLNTLIDQNRIAFQGGMPIPNIVTTQFIEVWIHIGGSGGTLPLALILAFKAKSRQLKDIGRLSLGPGIFNINEPIIFGMPIVMNPILILPFILSPLVTTTLTYFSMHYGLVPKPSGIIIPWTTPPLLGGFLATGGNIRGALMQLVNIFAAGIIYYPFFKILDKQKCSEELVE